MKTVHEHEEKHVEQNVITGVQNVISTGQNVIIEGQNVITPSTLKCSYCYKVFSCKKSLERHYTSCQNIEDSTVCWKCGKHLASRQSKSRHLKTCEGVQDDDQCDDTQITPSEQPKQVIQTQNNIQNQTIQTQQNIQTQNNVTQNVTVLQFPGFCYEDFDFDREHITKEMLNKIWDCPRPEIGFAKYASAILDNPKNRYLKKTDTKASHSSIHLGNGEWDMALDKDVFPRLTWDMSVSALGAYNDNKKKMRLMKINIDRIFRYLDNVNTENDPDFTDALQRLKLMVVSKTKRWEVET